MTPQLTAVDPQVLDIQALSTPDTVSPVWQMRPDTRRPLAPQALRLGMLLMPINPADLLQLQGRYGQQPDLPYTPGHEGLGVVLEVGSEVSGMQVGDFALPLMGVGHWRDEWVLPAKRVMPLGQLPRAQWAQAAMLKANPATALVMLRHVVELPRGAWVIQNAANSAVGQCVNAIAPELGLQVINVVRRSSALPPPSAGVAWCVDDGTGDLSAAVRALGTPAPLLALDAIGGEATARIAATLANGGQVLTYGLLSGQAPQVAAHDLVFRDIRLHGFWLAQWFQDPAHREAARAIYPQLLAWQARGLLHTQVEATYPLTAFDRALQHASQGMRQGKVLLSGAWFEAFTET